MTGGPLRFTPNQPGRQAPSATTWQDEETAKTGALTPLCNRARSGGDGGTQKGGGQPGSLAGLGADCTTAPIIAANKRGPSTPAERRCGSRSLLVSHSGANTQ